MSRHTGGCRQNCPPLLDQLLQRQEGTQPVCSTRLQQTRQVETIVHCPRARIWLGKSRAVGVVES